jgi:hypothetical protein
MFTRIEIINKIKTIKKCGGVYKWYMTIEGANLLGIPLEGATLKEGLYLVYVGLSKNMQGHLKWHCDDKHRFSSIKSGTLSILRQKLNTLITGRWDGKDEVDQFMNQHMKVEFEYSDKYKKIELREIIANKLPLNARNNPNFPKFRRSLSKRNGQAKRDSL